MTALAMCMLCACVLFFIPNAHAKNDNQAVELLLKSAASGDLNLVKRMIESGLDINTHDPVFHATALHNAAAEGHGPIIEWLLEHGASFRATDFQGSTPLIWAAYAGQSDATEALLAAGSDPNHVPNQGPTALIAAIQSGQVKVVKVLLKHGAMVSLADANGITPKRAAESVNNSTLLALVKAKKGEL